MTDTVLTSFTDSISYMLKSSVFPSIAKWLQENRQCQVDIDDLMTACSLSSSNSSGFPSTPSFLEKAKSARSRKQTVEGKSCERMIGRKGQESHACTKGATEAINDVWYCNACAKMMKSKTGKDVSPKIDEKKKLATKSIKIVEGRTFQVTTDDQVLIEILPDKEAAVAFGIWTDGKLIEMDKETADKYDKLGFVVKKASESGLDVGLKPIRTTFTKRAEAKSDVRQTTEAKSTDAPKSVEKEQATQAKSTDTPIVKEDEAKVAEIPKPETDAPKIRKSIVLRKTLPQTLQTTDT